MSHPVVDIGDFAVQEGSVSSAERELGITERVRVLHRGTGALHVIVRERAEFPATGTRLRCSCGWPICAAMRVAFPAEDTAA